MSASLQALELHECRPITTAEIEHYQTYGWVKLEQLIKPETVRLLLREAQARMGLDGDSNPPRAAQQTYFNLVSGDLLEHEQLRPFAKSLGRNGQRFMARGDATGMRLFADMFVAKLPHDMAARNEGQKRTDYHQDLPPMAIERGGGLTTWIALADLSPAAGTMDFLSTSHRMGPLGAHLTFPSGKQLTDLYPRLTGQCPSSAPITYKAGDATVHSVLTVHGAGENFTQTPRWAYIMTCIPEDSCWSGAPSGRFARSVAAGLKPFQRVDDENFPLLTD